MVTQPDLKIEVAEHVVDGTPGIYKASAEMAKDPDQKQLLHQASDTFQTIISNPDTRMALIESLVESPLIDKIMAQMDIMKQDPDAIKKLSTQLQTELGGTL